MVIAWRFAPTPRPRDSAPRQKGETHANRPSSARHYGHPQPRSAAVLDDVTVDERLAPVSRHRSRSPCPENCNTQQASYPGNGKGGHEFTSEGIQGFQKKSSKTPSCQRSRSYRDDTTPPDVQETTIQRRHQHPLQASPTTSTVSRVRRFAADKARKRLAEPKGSKWSSPPASSTMAFTAHRTNVVIRPCRSLRQ